MAAQFTDETRALKYRLQEELEGKKVYRTYSLSNIKSTTSIDTISELIDKLGACQKGTIYEKLLTKTSDVTQDD